VSSREELSRKAAKAQSATALLRLSLRLCGFAREISFHSHPMTVEFGTLMPCSFERIEQNQNYNVQG